MKGGGSQKEEEKTERDGSGERGGFGTIIRHSVNKGRRKYGKKAK